MKEIMYLKNLTMLNIDEITDFSHILLLDKLKYIYLIFYIYPDRTGLTNHYYNRLCKVLLNTDIIVTKTYEFSRCQC
jgi:hypothetical protein